MDEEKSLEKVVEEKIKWGHQMIEELRGVEKVEGTDKLIRKIQQEIKFLSKVIYISLFLIFKNTQ